MRAAQLCLVNAHAAQLCIVNARAAQLCIVNAHTAQLCIVNVHARCKTTTLRTTFILQSILFNLPHPTLFSYLLPLVVKPP